MSYYMLDGLGGLEGLGVPFMLPCPRGQRYVPYYGKCWPTTMAGFGVTAGGGGTPSSSGSFNASLIWADCLKGSAGDNAAGKRCGQSVQMALNQLGYGPLTVDGQIGSGTMAAIKAFSQDNGFGSANWPTKPMLLKMQELLAAGQKPGPSEAVESHVVGGEVVPGAAPGGGGGALAKAGLSTGMLLGIGAVVLIGIGALALTAKKKPAGASSSSTSTTHKAAANW